MKGVGDSPVTLKSVVVQKVIKTVVTMTSTSRRIKLTFSGTVPGRVNRVNLDSVTFLTTFYKLLHLRVLVVLLVDPTLPNTSKPVTTLSFEVRRKDCVIP